ncbi:AAA family ATPase [Solirubrobacter ginsenosidimutans]|uniref:AAA family ATPase n=1 Tax=Solirubrobacter ginsenosidimutans TaxID=490573 RepID=A0A9X3MQC5_9ACTN|nr:LuxR family transcriptional regulator [Solirubrobacter ginsenosidimutans]MDA0160375.1 AAA family ATPase [Solirubrobacter ginsenosidimutans]
MGLLGRQSECEALERLVAGVRDGESRVLVLRGEAGVGKTALLEHLSGSAAGCRIVRAAGVESEMELPFAGLHGLCASLLGHLRQLPVPQAAALSTAFGLSAGPPPDRFLVGLAVLTLLAEVAEEQPLVCVVDDAQWLDRVSAQTLAFVGRRLLAERVGLVFASRETGEEHALGGLPELMVEGLGAADARLLLDATIPGPLDEAVRDRILAEAAGNPLALLELPRGLTLASVAGGFGLPGTMTLASRMEQGFARRLKPLPAETRRLLLLAAADPVGDVMLLRRAAELLGIHPDAEAPAQTAGLIAIGTGVRFRHPLVRSAAYRAATAPERREVHRALAEATNAQLDPDRRAWHRANAAEGPDETVADELERSAGRARARGGVAAAAAFLEKATALTPDPARRAHRALAAAQAKFESAAPDAALELLTIAELCPLDDLQRARLARLRAEIVFALRRGRDAPPLLLEAAKELEALDGALARQTYLEAVGAAMYAGRLYSDSGVRTAAEAARAAPAAAGSPRPIDLILDGMARRFTEGPAAGAPPLRAAVQAFRDQPLDGHEETMRWLLLCPVVGSMAVFELWDDDAFEALAARGVRLARDTGALTTLPVVLPYLAGVRVFGGEFGVASSLIAEADAIIGATGNAGLVYSTVFLAAWHGVEGVAQELIDAGVASAMARGEGRVLALAGYATAVLNNGLGRYEAAIEGARRGSQDDVQGYTGWSLAELVEAGVRSGRPEVAAAALPGLEERTRAAGTDWALGVLARSHALVSEGAAAEALYREAIERLARTRIRVELARARLVYGEWLRRADRRVDAREQLRSAYAALAAFGSEAFAERARRELLATGETVRRRTAQTRDLLTPQETQIARLAADGHTNPEIGAQLFISPRTVEYHLRKVFGKLDINSRRELSGAL